MFQKLVFCLYSCIFAMFLLGEKSFCLDPYYEACVPKDCGNGLNLSYPFYIFGQQPPFCGYPGYEIYCSKQGYPTLHMLQSEYYVVDQIFYHNRSLRVHNAAVSSTNGSCLSQIRNLTLPTVLAEFYVNPMTNLFLFSNCSSSLPKELQRHKVGCDDINGDYWGLAMFDNDKYFDYASKACKSAVAVPVEKYRIDGSVGAENYTELLRRGFVLNWSSNKDCSDCTRSRGRCGFDDSRLYSLRCFCPDGPRTWNCDSSREVKILIISGRQGTKSYSTRKFVTGFSVSGIICATILYLYLMRKRLPGKSIRFWKKTEDQENIEAFLKNYTSLAPKRYNYSEIKKITSFFKDKLGEGGYGCVYKGMLHDGSLVAVKVLNKSKCNGEEFINEVASISRTSHVNIVALLGFCFEGSKRALIYEFMPNGSLEKFIYDENSMAEEQGQLGWDNLFQIAVGIARGLEYLHRGCNMRILHFDIKPHNILLDEDFHPKISDFSLAKLCPDRASKVSLLGTRGTIGYIAPEVFSRNFGEVSHKSDVYSYGMMVMEMVGSRKTADATADLSSAGFYFPHWIYQRLEFLEIGLQGIMDQDKYEKARKMTIVGLWCIQTFPITRPSISRVVEMLEGSLENLQIPPKPILSSPPRLATNSTTTSCCHSGQLELL